MEKTWLRLHFHKTFLGLSACLVWLAAASWLPAWNFASATPPTPSLILPPSPSGSIVSPRDGMLQIWIPAGKFRMGTSQAEIDQFIQQCPDCARDGDFADEQPQHTVHLDAYRIDQTEVTNAMYALCIQAGSCSRPAGQEKDFPTPGYDKHPVTGVSWVQAREYCAWAGRRLPTEAEWEKAARGTDGRIYPWGNQLPDCSKANFRREENPVIMDFCAGATVPGGMNPTFASPYGVLDMAGNVSEWVIDRYDPAYYQHSPEANPANLSQGIHVVLRGGSYMHNPYEIRSARRNFWSPIPIGSTVGFRCAQSAPQAEQPPQPQNTASAVRSATPQAPRKVETTAPLPPQTMPAPLPPPVTTIAGVDGMTLVHVPAGEFTMGALMDVITSYTFETPQKRIYLDAFWIDRTEVTNKMYTRCVEDGVCSSPFIKKSHTRDSYIDNPAYQDYPVIYVDWMQAKTYCEWAGRRLPSEAEWEKAARGGDGRSYPWGNQPPGCKLLNYGGLSPAFKGCQGDTAPVGSYPAGASPYGALDMAGNVSEWVSDWFQAYYYSWQPARNPPGPQGGHERVVRGSAWSFGWSPWWDPIRTERRRYARPESRQETLGFRCARSDAPPSEALSPEITASGAATPTRSYRMIIVTPTFIQTPTPLPTLQAQTDAPRPPGTSPADGMTQVYIPAGDFRMGSTWDDLHSLVALCPNCDFQWYFNELFQHIVHLEAFWIDQTEVTNAMYARCVEAGVCSPPANSSTPENARGSLPLAGGAYPVTNVDFDQASKYCAWAGRRLPGGAEWEKAARGRDGRVFPWGSQPPTCDLANFSGNAAGCPGGAAPAGSYPAGASPYGVLDMAGNVSEWVQDWYSKSDPTGTRAGGLRVLRGGSWADAGQDIHAAAVSWGYPPDANPAWGFRCARDAGPPLRATPAQGPLPAVPTAQPSPTLSKHTPTPSLEKTPGAAGRTPTPLPEKTPGAAASEPSQEGPPATAVSEADGMLLVRIPAGKFVMGSSPGSPGAYQDEQPQHTVSLEAYWIDQTEVTNAMYARCVASGGCSPPKSTASSLRPGYYTDARLADYPVIQVDWYQAQAYCRWAGRRLPSEAEWEKAARGVQAWIYPWGQHKPDLTWANINTQDGWDNKDPTAVGSHPAGASPYGVMDMAGNVWEWVNDWYSRRYYPQSPAANPTGPRSGPGRVIRGGSWNDDWVFVRAAVRNWSLPEESSSSLGFRCAR